MQCSSDGLNIKSTKESLSLYRSATVRAGDQIL
jgi:hypothetical protein